MKKSYLLGIDIGTSACKVAVFDREGRVLAAANGAYPVYYPHEGWAEQNPEEWWSAVCQATEETIQKAGIAPEEIAGVGIDGNRNKSGRKSPYQYSDLDGYQSTVYL